ncbi:HAD family hydrolase [Ignicoccus islandicus]|nr:HAD family phosphatase [Ignicoccus islandicus]
MAALLDLEGTLLDYEFWEELSRRHEKGEVLRDLLERGLSGQPWFESFIERVKAIIGTPKSLIEEVSSLALSKIKPEARELVTVLKKLGFTTIVVSGGFEEFVSPISNELGVDDFVSQKFLYHEGKVVGVYTAFKDKGEVVDKIKPWFDVIISIGDGYNDAWMLRKSDLGIVIGKRKDLSREVNALHYDSLRGLVEDIKKGGLVAQKLERFIKI